MTGPGGSRPTALALLRTDRGAEALTVHDTYRRRGAAELGTGLNCALKELRARAPVQDPAAVTAVPLTRPAPGRHGSAERS